MRGFTDSGLWDIMVLSFEFPTSGRCQAMLKSQCIIKVTGITSIKFGIILCPIF